MRYVPELIPAKFKVLPDYFKGDLYEPSRKNFLLKVLATAGAVIFFLVALINIRHPLVSLFSAIIGLIILPESQNWIEKTLRFQLTLKIKSVLAIVLIIASIPLSIRYKTLDKEAEANEKVQQAIIEQKNVEENKKEQLRKDSVNYFFKESEKYKSLNKLDAALSMLDSASHFALTENENNYISKERISIYATNASSMIKSGKYSSALILLTTLVEQDPNNADLFYNRGICYSKTGKIQSAVDDFRTAINLGNPKADAAFNKINPIRKRVIGYQSVCCDGTTSSATGRGACSHHGGVCQTEAIYESSRKYGPKSKSEE